MYRFVFVLLYTTFFGVMCTPACTQPLPKSEANETRSDQGQEKTSVELCPKESCEAKPEPTPDEATYSDEPKTSPESLEPVQDASDAKTPESAVEGTARDTSVDAPDDNQTGPEVAGDAGPEEPTPSATPIVVTLEYQATKLLVQPMVFSPSGAINFGFLISLPLDKYTYEGKAVTALAGELFYIVHFASKTGPYRVEQRRIFGFYPGKTHTITGRRPTALFARGDWVYVGGIEKLLTRIDTIYFGFISTAYAQKFTAKDSYRQEIDDFAIVGNRLIAIDDVVIPKYAFVFDIGKDGSFVKHSFTAFLPIVLDGTYPEGVASGDQLYIRAAFDYGHNLGSGQSLLRLEIDKNNIREKTTLNEYLPGNGKPDPKADLLYGTTFTKFQGMEVLGDVLLIGAGTRGILALPKLFKSSDKATHFDPGGDCTDITRVGTYVYALVQTTSKTTLLLRLAWDPITKKIFTQHKVTLPGRPTRFPR